MFPTKATFRIFEYFKSTGKINMWIWYFLSATFETMQPYYHIIKNDIVRFFLQSEKLYLSLYLHLSLPSLVNLDKLNLKKKGLI